MATAGGATILIVDDHERARALYRALLTREGYQVWEASRGEDALEILRSRRPDLILLDLYLPTLSGYEVLERLRADDATRTIPVIILSVEDDQDAIARGLRLGAADYLVKGFTPPRDVLGKIRGLLEKPGHRGRLAAYRLHVVEGRGDAARLAQDFGFPRLLECPECRVALEAEFLPEDSRPSGSWFRAHFVCPRCGRAF
ncbi:MAG: response regulator [Armatimonadota bacterium]|nr:response regulator [Armatimonadota bacterium]MDR7438151.1 response regulator [Armatimonadota bacterium]MDR7471440.1 response regulator [Armatimonadota bacterium]MDR7510292.1 response regulator [Armatimonadota bacterium]MDR7516633.1 response regulator [Armatimonadota bacterium]